MYQGINISEKRGRAYYQRYSWKTAWTNLGRICPCWKEFKVALVGFGTFSAVNRAARIGRNPQIGKEIKITAKTNGKFTPGKSLKDLNSKPVKAAPKAKAKAKK